VPTVSAKTGETLRTQLDIGGLGVACWPLRDVHFLFLPSRFGRFAEQRAKRTLVGKKSVSSLSNRNGRTTIVSAFGETPTSFQLASTHISNQQLRPAAVAS